MVAMGMVKGGKQASGRPEKCNDLDFPMITSVGVVFVRVVTTVSSQ
jgi:hypothetical protein